MYIYIYIYIYTYNVLLFYVILFYSLTYGSTDLPENTSTPITITITITIDLRIYGALKAPPTSGRSWRGPRREKSGGDFGSSQRGGLVKGGLATYVLLSYYCCQTPLYQTPPL